MHDKVLIFWLIYLGLYTGIYALFSERLFTSYHLLSASFISLLMLHGPVLFMYISALVEQKPRLNLKKILHFAPFALFNIYLFIASFSPEMAEGIRLDHVTGEHATPLLFNLFLIATALSGPVYFVASIALFRKLDINISNNFSSAENVNPDWLRNLVYSFGTIWTLLIAFAAIHHIFHLFSWSFCTDGLFLSLSVFIILIGYFGLKQKEIFVQFPGKEAEFVTEPRSKYSGILLKKEETDIYAVQITDFMEAERPYLDSNITLPQLAGQLQIPAHILSRVINEKFEINFFDFINGYRINEVKAKISDPQYDNLSLLGIAFESGFNTKSAFNRVFKKMTGLTPSEYRKRERPE